MLVRRGKSAVSDINGSLPSDSEDAMQYATTSGPCGVFTNCGFMKIFCDFPVNLALEISSLVARTKKAHVSDPSTPETTEGKVPTSSALRFLGILLAFADQTGIEAPFMIQSS
jgi:hypothetical protein